ncbi:hypothetical protein MMC30_003742 [Trapelia coarctata]|nr:hypothetical protein [Trapelia coarctata]
MAKRKRATQMTIFEPEDQIKLLAWLDYTLKYNIPFEGTVTEKLMVLCNKQFTLPKVKKRLYALWQRLGSNNARDQREILSKGSECLDGLDDEDKRSIGKALAMLEELLIHGQFSERRRLRSAARSEGQISESRDGFETVPTSNTERKTKGGSKPATSCAPKQEAAGSKPPEELGPAGRRKHEIQTQPSAKPRNEDVKIVDNPDAKGPIHLNRTVIRDSEEEDSSGVGDEWEKAEVRVKHKKARTEPRGRNSRFSERQLKSDRRRKRALKKAHAMNEAQQTLLQRQESDKKDLQDQIDCLELALREGSKSGDLIFRQERRIDELERKLKKTIYLGTFTKHSKMHSSLPRATDFEQEMLEIREGVRHILVGYDHNQPLIIPKLEAHCELKGLLYQALNLGPEKPVGMESLTWKLSEIDPRAVVRAVTAFALREWVFESDFPNFKENVSPVLARYREHLRTQDGPIVLRNLDSAAYDILIRDTHFRTHTIHERAKKLAKKLSRTLAPLFSPSSSDSPRSSFKTWGQDQDTWMDRRLRLVEIFEISLKLKADSRLNFERYELVFVSPGTVFDSSTMDAETMDGGRIDTLDRRTRQVRLCLYPSILAYTSQIAKEMGLPPIVTADSKNFIRRDKSQRVGAKVGTKAVVILEDTNYELEQNMQR